MKEVLRKLFSPLLNVFESDDGSFTYNKSHRKILLVVACLFLTLASVALSAGVVFAQWGALLPTLIFICVGLTCLVVGALGTDRAVAKIWGNK